MVKKKRGFTLIEIMITVAILGIVITSGTEIFTQIRRFFWMSNTKVEIQREARAVMSTITRRLRQSYYSTIVIDQVPSQPNYSRISFNDIDGNYIRYYQNGSTLYAVDNGTTTLTKNLRYLAFAIPRTDDISILSVSFTLEKQTYGSNTKSIHMASEKVRLMNE